MNESNTSHRLPSFVKLGIVLLLTLILTTACFTLGRQVPDEITHSISVTTTASNSTVPSSTLTSMPATTLQSSQINSIPHPRETPILTPLETPTPTTEGNSSCPVTAIQEDFWSGVESVAGNFPVWISSRGHVLYSKLGRIVLPPESSELTFNEGRATKALVFVDKSIEGDLTITGKRLDGPELVYFSDSEGLFTDIDDSTLQLVKIPPTVKTISSANISSHFPEPNDKAHHGMGLLYLSPGCYQFTATINQYTVQIVLELVNQ